MTVEEYFANKNRRGFWVIVWIVAGLLTTILTFFSFFPPITMAVVLVWILGAGVLGFWWDWRRLKDYKQLCAEDRKEIDNK